MFQCPQCKEKGIGIWAKLWSGSGSPATCHSCGELSYVHSKYRFGLQLAWPFLFSWLGIVLALYLSYLSNSIIPLIAIPFIWVAGKFWELSIQPLTPISMNEPVERKKFGFIFLIMILLVIFAGVTFGNL